MSESSEEPCYDEFIEKIIECDSSGVTAFVKRRAMEKITELVCKYIVSYEAADLTNDMSVYVQEFPESDARDLGDQINLFFGLTSLRSDKETADCLAKINKILEPSGFCLVIWGDGFKTTDPLKPSRIGNRIYW